MSMLLGFIPPADSTDWNFQVPSTYKGRMRVEPHKRIISKLLTKLPRALVYWLRMAQIQAS
jgi:hypothetical protein